MSNFWGREKTGKKSLFEAVASSLGMKIKRIKPYSPWQNGKVKRSSFVFKNLNYYVII